MNNISRERKRLFKTLMATVLAITMVFGLIQGLTLSGLFKQRMKVSAANQTLTAGNYLYLKTDFGSDNWQDLGANIYLYYFGSKTGLVKMDYYDANHVRVKLTSDMVSAGTFLFKRMSPSCSNPSTWTAADGFWNQTNNMQLSNAPGKCNVLKITAWNGNTDNGTENLAYRSSGTWMGTVSSAGETVYYRDLTTDVSKTVYAIFVSTSGTKKAVTMTYNATDGTYKAVVPADINADNLYEKVYFSESSSGTTNITGKTYNYSGTTTGSEVEMNLTSGSNTVYFGNVVSSGVASGSYVSGKPLNKSIAGKKIYFDKTVFPVSNTYTVKVGTGDAEIVSTKVDSGANEMFVYTVPSDSTATQSTVITVTDTASNVSYNFLWNNYSSNILTNSSGNYMMSGVYRLGGGITVYFDATLSKLSYENEGGSGDYGIPKKNSQTIYYYAIKNAGDSTGISGTLSYVNTSSTSNSSFDSVYKITLSSDYRYIAFSNFAMSNATNFGWNGESTDMLEIPELENPCFYADGSDKCGYNTFDGNRRGGYWDEVYEIRDAESGKGTDVVDISAEPFAADNNTLYVNSTFYDYYTDYELNGENRDSYGSSTGASLQNWYTFRHFNQALSEYYRKSNVAIPLYEGHFQPNEYADAYGVQYMSVVTGLYGFNNYKNFISTNNSGHDIHGNSGKYEYATQGLVSRNSNDGVIKTSGGETALPFFNENFLMGENSKNAKLGDVYKEVSFPFTKKEIGGVDYWYFDSAVTTLEMKKDSNSSAYFLKDVGNHSWSQNVNSTGTTAGADSVSTTYGFFPFNGGSMGTTGSTYNYGFGTKLEFKFRLTEDGKVLDKLGNKTDIKFNFSGDDDVWVFIDGKLALDVGGDHGFVSGELDFANKTATVSKVKEGANSDILGTSSNFTLSGSNTSTHTLTMYYMERGMWESNMKIQFNFPDENELVVEKVLDTDNVDDDFSGLFENAEFDFEIKNLATHYGAKAVSDSEATGFVTVQADIPDYGTATSNVMTHPNGAKYTSNINGNSTISSDGKFSLVNGENVTFFDQFRRGSYISVVEALTDSQKQLYDTKWSMYETVDDTPVANSAIPEETYTVSGTTTNMTDVSGYAISDGRVEKIGLLDGETAGLNAYQTAGIEVAPENSFVFRLYSQPDMMSNSTRLKMIYTNTVNTGSISITKDGLTDEDKSASGLDGTYQFKVEFSNVGGENLESATITKTVTIDYSSGETTKVIDGIPVGTEYKITEITPTDGSVLANVSATNGTVNDDLTATGTIAKDTEDEFTFYNTIVPKISLSVAKEWKDILGNNYTTNIPTEIKVVLQRKQEGANDSTYQNVKIDSTNNYILTLKKNEGWDGEFENLDEYVDHSVTPKVKWVYRVLELDSSNNPVLPNGMNGNYKVTYDYDEDTSIYTVTNTYIPKTSIEITKVDSEDSSLLGNVEFRIEKMNSAGTEVDSTFTAATKTTATSGASKGKVSFDNLEDGIYRITETKSLTGYSMLPYSIIVTIDRTSADGTTVSYGDGSTTSVCSVTNDKVSITVRNSKLFEFPHTGGNGRTIFILVGLLIMLMAGLTYSIFNKYGKTYAYAETSNKAYDEERIEFIEFDLEEKNVNEEKNSKKEK